MTIDKDTTGSVWATWTQVSGSSALGYTSSVYVNSSAPGGTSWGTPFVLPVSDPNPAPDDISSVVAYGKNKIGVMWSDQSTGSVWWVTRTDGQAATEWKVQTAVRGKNQADDHLNIKSLQADTSGRVFAAVKTALDLSSTSKVDPQLRLLVFKPGTGAFEQFTISTLGDCHTRPQIVLDPDNNKIHAFQTGPATTVTGCPYSGVSGAIYQKTASMDNPVFPSGRGTPVIQDAASPNMNNVTTSKQPVTSESGLVVMASDNVAKRYWFADFGVEGDEDGGGEYVPPAVSPFADVTSGQLFYKEICWLAGKEISTGWTEGDGTKTYRPLELVYRDAMAAFLYRLAGNPDFTPPAVSPFSDVTPSTLFYKEITWLAAQGISEGWTEPDGSKTFRPSMAVSRDVMAAFMYRHAGKPDFSEPSASPFTDVTGSTMFYKEIIWMAAQGISEGWTEADGTRTYRPYEPVKRDAMAAFMYRYNDKQGSL